MLLVLPLGRRIVLVKVPPKPVEASSSWLETEKGRGELRALAEAGALEARETRATGHSGPRLSYRRYRAQ
jgi:hypothetical protein